MCVTVRTLCLPVSSVPVIMSVARVVIHAMLHLMVHQGCDAFVTFKSFRHLTKWSVCRMLHLDMVVEQ